jgi:hypothetical protein
LRRVASSCELVQASNACGNVSFLKCQKGQNITIEGVNVPQSYSKAYGTWCRRQKQASPSPSQYLYVLGGMPASVNGPKMLINVYFFTFRNQFGGDVNISALLNSFQMGYDKRVRPNYGGKIQLKNYFKQTIIIND